MPGLVRAFAASFNVVNDLKVAGDSGTVPDPDLEVKGFFIFGSTSMLTHISTALWKFPAACM